jgi:hypothetical protein
MARVHGCERCLTGKTDYKQLQCSHFWGRTKRSVRFDEDNAAGLCPACHIYLTGHPFKHIEFFRKLLGQEAFELLEMRAGTRQELDVNAITIYLRVKIKELDNALDSNLVLFNE